MKKIRNIIFVVVLFLLLTGVGICVLTKKSETISLIENRYLATVNELNKASYWDGSFQTKLEDTLADQFFYRYDLVNMKKEWDYQMTNIMLAGNQDDFILNPLGDSEVYQIGTSNYMMNQLIPYREETAMLIRKRIQEFEALQQRHPETTIYVYHPTQIHETSFFDEANDMHSGGSQYEEILTQELKLPYAAFEIDNLAMYKENFFSSDHHLNHRGSYLMYQQIISLLQGEDEVVLEPTGLNCDAGKTFYGTYSSRTGYILKPSEYCVYTFDYPNMDIYDNENQLVENHVNTNTFTQNYKASEAVEQYPYYYVESSHIYEPLAKYDMHQSDKPNLLLVGDSYSRPIIDLMASHFNITYRLNANNYYANNGLKPFDYDSFIEENKIDKVIFMYAIENYFYVDDWGNRADETQIVSNGGN